MLKIKNKNKRTYFFSKKVTKSRCMGFFLRKTPMPFATHLRDFLQENNVNKRFLVRSSLMARADIFCKCLWRSSLWRSQQVLVTFC